LAPVLFLHDLCGSIVFDILQQTSAIICLPRSMLASEMLALDNEWIIKWANAYFTMSELFNRGENLCPILILRSRKQIGFQLKERRATYSAKKKRNKK
jgi:hypothetical protein